MAKVNFGIPFVYKIGWSDLNTWYIGCRVSANCNSTDLWTKYFTSSKFVKEFRKENGEPDYIEILGEFLNKDEALQFEKKKLIENGVLKKQNWLNRCIGGLFFDVTGRKCSDIHKRNVSLSKIGKKRKPFSEEWRKKLAETSRGRKQTPEAKLKKSFALKGRVFSEEHRKNLRKPKNLSLEQRQAISDRNRLHRHTEASKLKISLASRNKKLSAEHYKKLNSGYKKANEIRKLKNITWKEYGNE